MNFYHQLSAPSPVSEGLSPARVSRCTLQGRTVYLKTIPKLFAPTTYSVRREGAVMAWLQGKLRVPQVIECGEAGDSEYLIMTELNGQHIDRLMDSPEDYVTQLARAIRAVQGVDIQNCPFVSNLDTRLRELSYLLENGLADTDPAHWQQSTAFSSPQALYRWLVENRPAEDPVFSHGDISANFFIENGEPCFYDLARMGVADRWADIALALRDIREVCPALEPLFFEKLGLAPDPQKIDYYILLDELF